MNRRNLKQLRYIDWNNLHFALEWIYDATPAQRTHVGHHHFAGLSAWLIRRGGLTISGSGVKVEARAGDWVFPPFRADHRSFSDDLQIVSIRFRASWGGDNELYQESIPHRCSSKDHPGLERSARQLLAAAGPRLTTCKNEMMRQPVDIHHYAKIQRIFMKWIQEYLVVLDELGVQPHQVQITDERVRDAKTYLDAVPLDTTVREQALAEKVGISVAQLNRLFVKDIGVTPMAYFNERKFGYAKDTLINSVTPLKQIGLELGHGDQANFTNWFRAKAKMSPKAFRREAMKVE
jgi:AraC-like DNA-binding protein